MAKPVQLDANGYRKFGFIDKLAYAAGDFGCNMSFALKSYLTIFWTQFMGIDSIVMASLLLLVQVWDAINDPIIGAMIDNDKKTTYKRGKFLAYIWLGSVGLMFAGAACFLPFKGAAPMVKNILFVAGYIIWDAFYTIANVHYGSMLSVVTEDAGEHAQLSTWRSIGSMVGNILPSTIIPMLIWRKVTYNGSTDFLSNIEIPEGAEEMFSPDKFHNNPVTGEVYKAGEEVLSPLTGKPLEILLGDRVF